MYQHWLHPIKSIVQCRVMASKGIGLYILENEKGQVETESCTET